MVQKKPASKKLSIEEQVKQEVARQIPKVKTGMAIAIPNTVEQKMNAIRDLSRAVLNLSQALNSTHVNVRVENCHFQNHECGIRINE